MRVLRVPANSEYIYQKALISDELEDIFLSAPPNLSNAVKADDKVVKEYRYLSGESSEPVGVARKPFKGASCPICYEDIGFTQGKEQIDFCKSCGNNIHADCVKTWRIYNRDCPCPMCRAPNLGQIETRSFEGYTNLAGLQPGSSRSRDTSTYHHNPYGRYYANY